MATNHDTDRPDSPISSTEHALTELSFWAIALWKTSPIRGLCPRAA